MSAANLLEICVEYCRARQQRLLVEMQRLRLDAVVVMLPEHVQWLCGTRFTWHHAPLAALLADGRAILIAPITAPSLPVVGQSQP